MKDGVHENATSAEPGRDAPEVATCPACGGIVDLRSRRTGRSPDDRTWFFLHRRLRPGLSMAAGSRVASVGSWVRQRVYRQPTEAPKPSASPRSRLRMAPDGPTWLTKQRSSSSTRRNARASKGYQVNVDVEIAGHKVTPWFTAQ